MSDTGSPVKANLCTSVHIVYTPSTCNNIRLTSESTTVQSSRSSSQCTTIHDKVVHASIQAAALYAVAEGNVDAVGTVTCVLSQEILLMYLTLMLRLMLAVITNCF